MTEQRRRRRRRPGGAAAHVAQTFDELGLSATALAAVADMGYEVPTPVQAQAIPAVLAGRDVMAAAQTGTGKTAAFLLPILDRLGHVGRGEGPLVLVVTPTRELAQQITDVAQVVCARTHHRVTTVVGGVGYDPQRDALRRGCDLLVATPGRLIDLIDQGSCDLSQVQVLVLDEADRMLDMGFLPAMRTIVGHAPMSRQTLLFSATLSDDVLRNTLSLVREPVRVEIAPKGTAAETVEQYVLGVAPEAKKRVLVEVLRREGAERVIVFVKGKHRADHLSRVLRKKGFSCAPIHGNRSQNQRARALAQFASGEVGVLVATDVLARGIDIADVAYVLNVDVPHEAEDYIHRIGRTGRAGERGWALTLCTEDEYLDLRDIEQLMGRVIPAYPRAQGMDVGESPFVPDPARNPKDRLPGKKARKKMAQNREQGRRQGGERPAGRSEVGAAGKAGKRAADKPASSRGFGASKAGDKGRSRSADKARSKAGATDGGGRVDKGRNKSADKAAQRRSKAASQAKPAPRRHPGDRRGMRGGTR